MELYQILDILNGQRALIGATWSMFVGLHLAMVGGLFVAVRRICLFEKVLAFAIYAAFMGLNFLAQADNYEYLDALIRSARSANTAAANQIDIVAPLTDMTWISNWLPAIYLGALVIVLVSLSFINRLGSADQPPAS